MTATVLELHTGLKSENERITKSIETFLEGKGLKSANTKTTYTKSISQFFEDTRGKKLDELVMSDLVFTFEEVQNYQISLTKVMKDKEGKVRKYKNKTINGKIDAVRSLYKYLMSNDYPVKRAWFDIDNLTEFDSDSYSVITWEVAEQFINAVKGHKDGEVKSLLIELAVVTSYRLDSMLEMTWDCFGEKNGVKCVKVLGKGQKWDEKPIKKELFERFMELKKQSNSDKVFPSNLYARAVTRMMDKLKKELGIVDKNLTFHSFKKCGMYEVNVITGGDIKEIQRQGNHSSELTPLKFYMEQSKDLSQMPCLQIGEQVDLSPLESLDKDELIKLIMSSGRDVQTKLMQTFEATEQN
ncbi:tyrosine-type recombinase/integrase [Bacillus anthracis]|uniref:tyrosine-type recombinase/integrase n=1 Tax=Bacillus anthracis TaxID=1392 RepID=UPI003D1ED21E